MHTLPLGITTAIVLAALSTGAVADDDGGACTQTAGALRRACDNEARDDYWVALAKCTNVVDAGERRACRQDARGAQRDATTECADQLDAREDLCDDAGEAPYDPDLSPSRFVSPAAAAADPNPFLRLVPGSTRVYEKGTETIIVTVTDRVKVVQGVTCTVVQDVVTDGGQLVEDTEDYFAQDLTGNVWYFGEAVKNYENGELATLDGSFVSGTNGDKAGLAMPAAPVVGVTYRQEFALGNAEDAARVLSVTGSASVPAASCAGTCLVTRDFTPIEPGHDEEKYFAPGIGMILEVVVETGERLELVGYSN